MIKNKKMNITHLAIITIIFGMFLCMGLIANAYSSCATNIDCSNGGAFQTGSSSIMIYRDSFSPSSIVHIIIHAPDFNSNQYAIDKIGVDEDNIVISTRESRLPYMLVETGPDTGDFAGYVILSSTTSQCSPVCGPTNGFLAAGGDDAITVSFTYSQGHTISSTTYEMTQSNVRHKTIPEFKTETLALFLGVITMIFFSKTKPM